MSGKLRVGRLRYYRELESRGGRGDSNEGICSVIAPRDSIISLRVEGGKFRNLDDGFVSATLASNSDLDSYVLCMTKIYYTNQDNNARVLFEDLGKLVEDFCASDLEATYVVVIVDPEAFKRRLIVSTYLKYCRFVEYIDVDNPSESRITKGAFLKDRKYQHQKEFRFQFDSRGEVRRNHWTIDIGDISDIAIMLRLSDHELQPKT